MRKSTILQTLRPRLLSLLAVGCLLAGTFSGGLNGIAHSFLRQTVDLRNAVSPVNLAWTDEYFGQSTFMLDNVSLVDNNATQFLTNGGFETGDLTGWSGTPAAEPQNVLSGMRATGGLDVQRSCYTEPNRLWGRQADTFTNNTGATINTTIFYLTNLGSDNSGIIYFVDNTNNQAIGTWDGSANDRDIGFVFGNANTVVFTSATFGNADGDDTGQTATSAADRATVTDNQASTIRANFRVDPRLQDGLTQTQINTIINT